MPCSRGCCETQGDHYRSLAISPSVHNPHVGMQNRYDRSLARDRDAYKRMRTEGLQPAHLKGAAQIEKNAISEFEVTTGRIQPEKVARKMDAAIAEAAQIRQAAA